MDRNGRDRDLSRTPEGEPRGATRRAFLQGAGGLWLSGAVFGGFAGRATAAFHDPDGNVIRLVEGEITYTRR